MAPRRRTIGQSACAECGNIWELLNDSSGRVTGVVPVAVASDDHAPLAESEFTGAVCEGRAGDRSDGLEALMDFGIDPDLDAVACVDERILEVHVQQPVLRGKAGVFLQRCESKQLVWVALWCRHFWLILGST